MAASFSSLLPLPNCTKGKLVAPNASADTVSVDLAGSMVGNAAISDQLIVLPVDAADAETAGKATLPTIVTDAATAATFPNFFIPNSPL